MKLASSSQVWRRPKPGLSRILSMPSRGERGTADGALLVVCIGARTFPLSLLERQPLWEQADGASPFTSDVVGDCRHAGL